MGCKYKIDEFKPFVSGKRKIIPTVAGDWELQAKSYNTTDGVALHSPSLGTTIYDLNFRDFLKFLVEENVTMIGNKIGGRFIIGQARVLRKEKDYLETMSVKSERTQTIIPKKEYIIGATYETVCGETLIYLGERYTQTISSNKKGVKLSNITKKYFAVGTESYNSVQDITSRKFVKLISEPTKAIEAYEDKLNKGFDKDYYIAVSKTKEEITKPLEFVEDPQGKFYKTDNGMAYVYWFRNYNETNTGHIIYDDHLPGELTEFKISTRQVSYKTYETPTRYSIKR